MTKKNPFKEIEPDVSLPDDLKEEIIQEVKEIIEKEESDQESDTSKTEE